MQFPAESGKLVVECPQRLAAFGPCQHILSAPFGYCVIKEREYRYQFRCRFDIQVVHTHSGDDALRIVPDDLA